MLQLKIDVTAPDMPNASSIRKATGQALKIWAAYFRKRVQHRFEAGGPGWAPRKAESDALSAARESRASSLSDHRLRRKLVRELERAQLRMGKGRGTPAAVFRRAAVLREFDRQQRGGAVGAGSKLKQGSKAQAIATLMGTVIGSKSLQKSLAGLRDRKARNEITQSGRVLGRVAQSIKTKFETGAVEIASHIPWSNVQNEGGPVGKNATLPARPFIFIEGEDVTMLQEIVSNRLLAAFEGGR